MENPYSAPAAHIGGSNADVPDEVLKKIRHAWVAAIFSGGITLAATLVAMSGTDVLGFSAWELIDVALIFGLAFGIYRKSRTCAAVMFCYFIASKILLATQVGIAGVPMAIIFGYFFWQGVSGTFAYHKIANP